MIAYNILQYNLHLKHICYHFTFCNIHEIYISFLVLLYFILYFINDATVVVRKHRDWKHFMSTKIAWPMCLFIKK